jgi:hypothetical protein
MNVDIDTLFELVDDDNTVDVSVFLSHPNSNVVPASIFANAHSVNMLETLLRFFPHDGVSITGLSPLSQVLTQSRTNLITMLQMVNFFLNRQVSCVDVRLSPWTIWLTLCHERYVQNPKIYIEIFKSLSRPEWVVVTNNLALYSGRWSAEMWTDVSSYISASSFPILLTEDGSPPINVSARCEGATKLTRLLAEINPETLSLLSPVQKAPLCVSVAIGYNPLPAQRAQCLLLYAQKEYTRINYLYPMASAKPDDATLFWVFQKLISYLHNDDVENALHELYRQDEMIASVTESMQEATLLLLRFPGTRLLQDPDVLGMVISMFDLDNAYGERLLKEAFNCIWRANPNAREDGHLQRLLSEFEFNDKLRIVWEAAAYRARRIRRAKKMIISKISAVQTLMRRGQEAPSTGSRSFANKSMNYAQRGMQLPRGKLFSKRSDCYTHSEFSREQLLHVLSGVPGLHIPNLQLMSRKELCDQLSQINDNTVYSTHITESDCYPGVSNTELAGIIRKMGNRAGIRVSPDTPRDILCLVLRELRESEQEVDSDNEMPAKRIHLNAQ